MWVKFIFSKTNFDNTLFFMSRLMLIHWLNYYYYFVGLQWMVGFLAVSCSAGAVVGGAICANKLFKKKSNAAPRFQQQLSRMQTTEDTLDGDEIDTSRLLGSCILY